jgi:hypothetical protein
MVQLLNADGTTEQSTRSTAAESQLAIAQRDPKVAKVLRIFGSREHNWHNLNNIFEVVQSDVGGQITKAGWATQAELDRFTQTANSTEAIGDDARHGSEKFPAPKNPMSLADADALVIEQLFQVNPLCRDSRNPLPSDLVPPNRHHSATISWQNRQNPRPKDSDFALPVHHTPLPPAPSGNQQHLHYASERTPSVIPSSLDVTSCQHPSEPRKWVQMIVTDP